MSQMNREFKTVNELMVITDKIGTMLDEEYDLTIAEGQIVIAMLQHKSYFHMTQALIKDHDQHRTTSMLLDILNKKRQGKGQDNGKAEADKVRVKMCRPENEHNEGRAERAKEDSQATTG